MSWDGTDDLSDATPPSAVEWSNYLPEFHHDLGINVVKTSTRKEDITQKNKVDNNISKKNQHDLTMEFLTKEQKRNKIRNISITEYEIVDDHVVYKIEIHIQECSWLLSRRYREFHRLHEELVHSCGIAWELLPPKKIVGNLKPSNIEKRKVLLEKYLKNVIHILVDLPRPLIEFLEIDQFDVHAVCRNLASDLYEIGDELLNKRLIFKITPLQIHCVNRRLQLPLPTNDGGSPREDIGHLYSFIQQVRKVLVYPGDETHMFIGQTDLNYDLSIFKSLRYLEVQRCDIELMEGIEVVQKTVKEVRAHKTIQLLKDFLIGSESWTQGVLMTVNAGKEEHGDVVSQFQTWKKVQRAAFSYNDLQCIDYSIEKGTSQDVDVKNQTLLPKIEVLDLSHNLLTEVQYLEEKGTSQDVDVKNQELTFLSDLNLSYNEIRNLGEFHYRLPSVSRLNLAGNGIHSIAGLEKMYALQMLDVSNNKLQQVCDVLPLCNLPMLESFYVRGNPLCEEQHSRERLFVQFAERVEEIQLDGFKPTKKELSRVNEMLRSRESYDIISEEPYDHTSINDDQTSDQLKPPPVENKTQSAVVSKTTTTTTTRSPRIKKKDRIVQIDPPHPSTPVASHLQNVENEEENFRERIEQLREHAGESWLTFYNETMHEEKEKGTSQDVDVKNQTSDNSEEALRAEKNEISNNTTDLSVKHVESTANDETQPVLEKPAFVRYFSTEEIDLELSDDLRSQVKLLINENKDLSSETFLVIHKDGSEVVKEHMVAIEDMKILLEIDFDSGSTLAQYELESIRGLTVVEEDKIYTLQFEAQKHLKQGSVENYSLVKLQTQSLKDAAGLYILLKSPNDRTRNRLHSLQGMDVTAGLVENPFNIPNELLLAFFQEFLRKVSLQKKSSTKTTTQQQSTTSTNYENIDIGLSLLSHNLCDSSNQDIVAVLWVGCLPYLFPDEEIPACIVITTLNVFLFRVFLPESVNDRNKKMTMSAIQDAMHCFYSFPLKALREIVVGLFDQGLRIEVGEEGPRGTFVFLTRDAKKTGQFLDALSAIFGFKNEKELVRTRSEISSESIESGHTGIPKIVYPDENKINALKMQLQEQGLSALNNRENLISYSIVYERKQAEDLPSYCEENIPYLRSLILTNIRLILCDEDYVHWPLPSFVRSAPFTPQWVVDDVENVENIIAVDLWMDEEGKENFTGSHGVTLTFERKSSEIEDSTDVKTVWNVLFQSSVEREQFVRSVACLWKNNFDQDLKVTHVKTGLLKTPFVKSHAKKSSGNISIPSYQSLDNPEMFLQIDRPRLNELFRNKIAQDDDCEIAGVQFVTYVGCKPYIYPGVEFDVTLLLGKYNIYMLCEAQNRQYALANIHFDDDSGLSSLYINVIPIRDLRQVVVGLFDQCFRLETGLPEQTFVFVTRNFDRTNDFIQRLSQVILTLPKELDINTERTTPKPVTEIFKAYKSDDPNDTNYYPKSEFFHPNSQIKFVYPSDDVLTKLRCKILDYIKIMELFETADDFGVLLYALIDQVKDKVVVPCTIVVSEKFICLIDEDHVNYPLPLFVHELPERSQYEVVNIQQIHTLQRIEFHEFHSSSFSLVFNESISNPLSYDERFKTSSVENDACLITEINTLSVKEDSEVMWYLQAHSYGEREKIFNILSKMWANNFSGKTLPILMKKDK